MAGHPVIHTPGIDALATTGHYFPCAYTEQPACVGARRTLFSGQHPRTHGMVGFDDMEEWDEPDTLCRVFQRNGYHTYSVGKRHVYPQDAEYGFDLLRTHEEGRFLSPGYRDDYLTFLEQRGWGDFGLFGSGVTNNSYTGRASMMPEELHVTSWTATEAIHVMDQHVSDHGRDAPFFLFISFSKPHPPWDPPAVFFDRYIDDPDLPLPVVGDAARYLQGESPFVKGARGPFPEAEFKEASARHLRRWRAAYYGLIDQVDSQITRFTYHMWRTLMLRNLLFVYVSDHGEMLGDQHWWAKSVGYEGSTRVPFILNLPSSFDDEVTAGPRYEDETVGLADLMPTLLDACGLPIPDKVDGHSLMPLLRGEVASLGRELWHGEHEEYGQYLWAGSERFLWHYRMGKREYYDLSEDPEQRRNLADEGHPRAEQMEQQLIDLLGDQGRADQFVRDGRLDDELARSQENHTPPPYAV